MGQRSREAEGRCGESLGGEEGEKTELGCKINELIEKRIIRNN